MKKKTTVSIILGLALCLPVAMPDLAFAEGRSNVRQSKRATKPSVRQPTRQRPKTSVRPSTRQHPQTSVQRSRQRNRSTVTRHQTQNHRRTHVRHQRPPHVHHGHGYGYGGYHHAHHAHYHYGYVDPCYDGYHQSGVFWDIHWQLPVFHMGIHGHR